MAVGIDNVYQQVLAIANKEQRGYITPQEFNLLARKAQLDIFEGLFHDYKTTFLTPGNNSSSGDDYEMLRDKIAVHRVHGGDVDTDGSININAHWLEKVYDGNSYRQIEVAIPAASTIDDDISMLGLRAIYDSTGAVGAGETFWKIFFSTSGGSISNNDVAGANTIHVVSSKTASQFASQLMKYINDNSP